MIKVMHKDIGQPIALLERHADATDKRVLMTISVPSGMPNKWPKPEVLIVADQNGSMKGGRTDSLLAALRTLLKSLPVGIAFNICAFVSTHKLLWGKSHVYDEISLEHVLSFIGQFDAIYGGTETLAALKAAVKTPDPEKNLSIMLATDGDIFLQDQLLSY